jgi:hypothetical protein
VRIDMKKLSSETLENLYPEIERVIDLVVRAFGGKEISNGAIIIGLGAVIGLTLNEGMPGADKPEAPEIDVVIPFIEAGMEFGRGMKIGRVQ